MPATLGPNIKVMYVRQPGPTEFRPVSSPLKRQTAKKVNLQLENVFGFHGNVSVTGKYGGARNVNLQRGIGNLYNKHLGGTQSSQRNGERKTFWIGKDKPEVTPITRAKSAPSKVMYMDKKGNISGRVLSRPVTAQTGKRTPEVKQTRPGINKDQENLEDQNGDRSSENAWGTEDFSSNYHSKGNDKAIRWGHGTFASQSDVSLFNEDAKKTLNDTEKRDEDDAEDRRPVWDWMTRSGHESSVNHLKALRLNSRQRRRKTSSNDHPATVVDEEEMLHHSYRQLPVSQRTNELVKYVKLICRVIRLLAAMIESSSRMTSRSATEVQWYTLNNSREVKEMVFNKAAFAKERAVSKFPKWALLILEKAPDMRTEQELRRVHALLRGLKSFDKFTEKIQLSMCQAFTYHRVEPGRIILRQGHIGVNFYFLFTGSVFVNVNDVDKHGNQFVKTEVILRKGDSFGELALLQDIRRTATISCREECELLVVDKYTFAKVCPRIFEHELEEKMRFYSKLDMFNSKVWSRESLKTLSSEAQIQEYKTNKVVVVDSTNDEWLYICMEGKCEVLRRLDLDEEIAYRQDQQDKILGNASDKNDINYLLGHMASSHAAYLEDERSSDITNLDQGRERLLDSMGLEYSSSKRRHHRKVSRSEGRRSRRPREGMYGPLTLTALLAQEERENTAGKHYLYLNIKTLGYKDVFDLYSLVNPTEQLTNGSYLLVSLGARLVRVKRSSFLHQASQNALELIRAIAEKEKYPSDNVLLKCYRDYLHWELYKDTLVQSATKPSLKSSRTSNLLKQMKPSVEETNKRKRRLLAELKKVLESEENLVSKIPFWKLEEKLTTASLQTLQSRSKEHNVTLYPTEVNSQNFEHAYFQLPAGYQRRSSVATSMLQRGGHPMPGLIVLDRRRYSQPLAVKEFATIEEMEEIPSPVPQEKY